MLCPACSADNPSGLTFCGQCGALLPFECPHCGLETTPDLVFCGHCGTDLTQLPPDSTRALLEGERRFVVVLFADIAGFTPLSEELDPEEATKLLNRCLDVMTRAVIQQGGRLDKYIGDGLMTVFGAPTAHEDDPERALRAALAMQQAVGRLKLALNQPPISLHIGLACGQVVAARVGSRGRKEYTVIGTTVNLAARLEEASAPGQILVSEELAHSTELAFSFQPVTLPQLQGWDGPVRAFELLGARPGAVPSHRIEGLHSPLVGRETQMASLWQTLEKLVDGQGHAVSVIGEAGVGKSRLLAALQTQARERGMNLTWLEASCPEQVRYGLFQALLRNTVGATDKTDHARTAERLQTSLEALMPDQASETYPYLSRLLGLPLSLEMSERIERLDGESLKWQTYQALQRWVSALAKRQPLVLVVEDLQWADPGSIELLEQVLPLVEQMPLLILWACRPEADRPAWAFIHTIQEEHPRICTELWLHPLPPEEAEQMVAHLLQVDQAPPEAAELILERSESNPLFIQEIVRSIIDQKILTQSETGRWQLASDWSKITVPDTIQGILQARIDRLDQESKRVLQLAACIGRRFPYKLLAWVSDTVGVPQYRLDQCLATLEGTALIQREEKTLEEIYTFEHVLVRDIVHSNLLKSVRARFHAAAAWWYEENVLQDPEPPYALLAHHYEQTPNKEKQRLYLIKAGHQAARSYANQEARAFFSKALTLSKDPVERFELLLARERASHSIGDRPSQKADLEELLQLANQSGDPKQQALVYTRLANWHESQSNYPAARSAAEKGLEAARQAGDRRLEAESLQRSASAAWRQGRFDTALEAAQTALEVARASGDAEREATSLTTMGIVCRSRDDLASARTCYQQALDIRRAIGDQHGEAISLTQLANLFYDQGDYIQALDYHRQALDLIRRVGVRRSEAWSLSGLGTVYLHCGDYQAAYTCYERALAIRQAIGDRRGEGVALSDLGNALLALGQWEAAKIQLERSVLLLKEIGARRDEVFSLTYLARALEKTGDLGGALSAHQSALSLRRELGQVAASMENVSGLARLALQRGDLEAARAYVEELLVHVGQHGLAHIEFPFQVYQTSLHILETLGEKESARQVLEQAYQLLQARAERITDPALRDAFLERVPEHRAIVIAWNRQVG